MPTVIDTLVTRYVLDGKAYEDGASKVARSSRNAAVDIAGLQSVFKAAASGLAVASASIAGVALVGLAPMFASIRLGVTEAGRAGKTAFDTLQYQFERAIVSMGDVLLKHVIPIVDRIGLVFEKLTDSGAFEKMGQVVVGVFKAIEFAIQPVLIIMGAMFGVRMLGMIQTIVTAYKAWRAATIGMAAAQSLLMILSGVGIPQVLAAIAGAAAVGFGLKAFSDWVDGESGSYKAKADSRPPGPIKAAKDGWVDRPAPNQSNFPEWMKQGISYDEWVKRGRPSLDSSDKTANDPFLRDDVLQSESVRVLRAIESNTAPIREMMQYIFGGGELGRSGVSPVSMKGGASQVRQLRKLNSIGILS